MTLKKEKIFITGVAGFIGSHLAEHFLDLGFSVVGLDNFSTGKPQNMNTFRSHPHFQFVEGSIADEQLLKKSLVGIHTVIHQAALVSVPLGEKEPIRCFQENVSGFQVLMEASFQAQVKLFLYASSSAVYGPSNSPCAENQALMPLSHYALSKKLNEDLAHWYQQQGKLHCLGFRYFNVYGERQDPTSQYSGVIAKFIKASQNMEEISIFGSGEQCRDFVYVKDLVKAYSHAMNSYLEGGSLPPVLNIGTGYSISINRLIELLEKIQPFKHINCLEARMGDIYFSQANTKELMEFGPKLYWTPFHEGIQYLLRN
jgi:nucleoside-diphosphate-sugar epimerase